jgi:hypothetical protein
MKVMFTFTHVKCESEEIRTKIDLLLGVTAQFEISVDDRILYFEESFPIVEFRTQLLNWLRNDFVEFEDFDFQSMESEEEGLVWFHRQPSGQWRVGSAFEEFIEFRTLLDNDVSHIVESYVAVVDSWALENLDVNIDSFLTA